MEAGRRVSWDYDPDDASQAVEAGSIADEEEDDFFPASIMVYRLQTTTHTYSTPFVVYVNCHFLSLVTRHHSSVPLVVHFAKMFCFYIHSFPFLHISAH